MSSDPKTPGGRPEPPRSRTCTPDQPPAPKDPYGGVWAGGGPREDTSGQGSAPRPPGAPEQPAAKPTAEPPEPPAGGDVYGGVWSSEAPREDASGRGSAPRPPDAPHAPERKSFSGAEPGGEDEEGPQIAADDAGASGRTETPQRKTD